MFNHESLDHGEFLVVSHDLQVGRIVKAVSTHQVSIPNTLPAINTSKDAAVADAWTGGLTILRTLGSRADVSNASNLAAKLRSIATKVWRTFDGDSVLLYC